MTTQVLPEPTIEPQRKSVSIRVIIQLHTGFVEAGAMVIETNTFGANRIVLDEYGLQDQVEAINRAGVDCARTAIDGKADTYIAGSIGPGTKLPSLGHISVDDLASAYEEQIDHQLADERYLLQ